MAEAPGYQSGQKEVSVAFPMRAQVDVYLQKDSAAGNTSRVPGRPVLASKAKEAFDKGLQALSADQLPQAGKFVGQAVRLAPSPPDVLYVQGVLYLKQGNLAQAQNALEKATQIDPYHARAFAALGTTLSDEGNYEAAIAPLEKSLQLDATADMETQWVAAKAYYQTGRYDDALKSSKSARSESKGKAPEIALLVAQALTAVGRYDDAAQTLRAFLHEHGDRPEAAKARRWLEALRSSGKIARQWSVFWLREPIVSVLFRAYSVWVSSWIWVSRAWLYWRSICSSVWSFLTRSSRRATSARSFCASLLGTVRSWGGVDGGAAWLCWPG